MLGFPHKLMGVLRTGEIITDVVSREFKVFHPFHRYLTEVLLFSPPSRINDLLGLYLRIDYFPDTRPAVLQPLTCLLSSSNDNDCFVIHKIYNVPCHTVMGEEGVQQQT